MNTTLRETLNLKGLFSNSEGSPTIRVAIIDGAVNASHADFSQTPIIQLGKDSPSVCSSPSSPSCQHGTFVTGLLGAKRESPTPGICPQCTLLVKPIFCEADSLSQCPSE